MCHAVFPQMYLHRMSFPELPTRGSELQYRYLYLYHEGIFTLSIESHARTLPSVGS